jgi:hypothetical protein
MSDDALNKPASHPIPDQLGVAERFQRGLRRALNTPPGPHGEIPKCPPSPKAKEWPDE